MKDTHNAKAYLHHDIEAFGADPWLIGFWALLAGGLVAIQLLGLITHGVQRDTVESLILCSILLTAILVFSLRFRATFSETTFIYRRWGRTVSIPYSQIDHIEVTNRTLISKEAVGAFVITHDGNRYPFWPKLFPRRAIARFMALGPIRG